MALRLEIAVDVEGNAKRELAAIESGIKKVEGAAKSTQDPISKVTSNITGLAESEHRLTQAVIDDNEAWLKQVQTLGSTQRAADQLKTTETGLAAALTSVTTATGLSTTALATLTGGLALAAAGSVALGAVLVKSTRYYFEHADATKDSRDALDELSRGWERFQMMVGGAVLGGEFSIVRPVTALNAALQTAGAFLAVNIDRTRDWVEWFAKLRAFAPSWMGGGPGMAGTLDFFSKPPGREIATKGSGLADPFEVDWLAQGPARWEERQKRLERERKKAEAEAEKIIEFWREAGIGVISGLVGGFPKWSEVDIPEWARAGGVGPWMDTLGQGSRRGVPGYELSTNPFDASNAIPLPLWVQRLGRSPNIDIYEYWRQHGGGPDSRGFFGRNFNNPFARGGLSGSQYGANLYNVGMGLAGGAQDVWEATSQGGAGKRALSGAMSGAQVGMMFGPWGAAIGAGVGALVGAIKGWMAPTEYELRVRQEQKDRVSAADLLKAPGLERMWNFAGGNVPFGFDFLKTQVEHDPTAVRGYIDDMLAKTERLQAAMEKYGISWEQLGEKARQSQIDQMAEDLILDFDVLTAAGADVNFVIEKMGGSINEFVESALRTGTEIPMAMKPMIERAKEMGLVTADLEDITWAKTMTQGFDSIVEAINRVAIGLGVDIPDAIAKIPKTVDIDVTYREKSPNFPDYQDAGGSSDGEPPLTQSSMTFGASRPAMQRQLVVQVPLKLGRQVIAEAVAQMVIAG